VTVPLAVLVIAASLVPMVQVAVPRIKWPALVQQAWRVVASFRSVNRYGLFSEMTRERPEIIIEGSDDGETWREYQLHWKPGDVHRRPAFTGLHMPRLDWMLWFAALGDFRHNPWFFNLLDQLLEGSPEVLALFEPGPFGGKPPRWVRGVLYDYHFTDWTTHRETGAWWRRVYLGPYGPVLPLEGEKD
jgi:hypothetical protein